MQEKKSHKNEKDSVAEAFFDNMDLQGLEPGTDRL